MNFYQLCAASEELVLRPARREDLPAFSAGYGQCAPPKNRFDQGGIDTAFMTPEWFEELLTRREREASRDYSYLFELFRREDGRAVGYGDITTMFREDFQFAKIGYTIHNPWWGRGYGTQCAALLVKIGFEQLNFHRLEAHINVDNPASKAVARKNGFQLECVRKGFILEDGVWRDQEIYYRNNQCWRELEEAKG